MKKIRTLVSLTVFTAMLWIPLQTMAYITASGCDTSIQSCSDEGTYLNCDPSIQSCAEEESPSASSSSSESSSSSSSSSSEEEIQCENPGDGVAVGTSLDALPSCSDDDILQFDEVTKYLNATDKGFIFTELYEPIGSFEQKIKSGDLTVSQVFWKFNCRTPLVKSWNMEHTAIENVAACKKSPGKQSVISTSGYVPYETDCPDGAKCTLVQIIIGQSGTGILKTYVAIIYRWAAGIVGIIAVLVMVVSGIQISIDQGSGEGLTAAKNRITQSLAGLVILFLSALILYSINPTFFTK